MYGWLVLLAVVGCGFAPGHAIDDAPVAPGDAIDAEVDARIDAAIDAPAPSIELVQVCSGVSSSSATTISCTIAGPQVAGHTNLVVVDWSGGNNSLSSLVDTAGNSYVTTGLQVAASFSQRLSYAANIRNAAPGTNVITATTSGNVLNLKLRLFEYAGLSTTNPYETGTVGSGSGAVITSGLVTTATSHTLLFAATRPQHASAAVAPFTARDTSDGDLVEDRETFVAGPYTASAAQSPAGTWVMTLGAFRAQ